MKTVRQLKPGDEITTAFLAGLAEAVLELQQLAVVNVQPPLSRQLNTLLCLPAKPTEIRILNDSGETLDRGAILGISDAVYDPTEDLTSFQAHPPYLKGDTPADPDHIGRFAVLLEKITYGQYGRAAVGGTVACQINVTTEEAADHADIADGETGYLATGGSGSAQVLWREGGTGTQYAIVLLGAGGAVVDSPTALLPEIGDIEEETAQTDAWDRDDPETAERGAEVRVCTRVVYDEAGDQLLYAFYRTLTLDSTGRVATVSAETRATVDTPEECGT